MEKKDKNTDRLVLGEREAASALRWWLEYGADVPIQEQARNWFERGAGIPKPQRNHEAPAASPPAAVPAVTHANTAAARTRAVNH